MNIFNNLELSFLLTHFVLFYLPIFDAYNKYRYLDASQRQVIND